LTGYVVGEQAATLYEISPVVGFYLSEQHALLRTHQTAFSSKGRFNMLVKTQKEKFPVTLKEEFGNFTQMWIVYEEVSKEEMVQLSNLRGSVKRQKADLVEDKLKLSLTMRRLQKSKERLETTMQALISANTPPRIGSSTITLPTPDPLQRIEENRKCTLSGKLAKQLFYGPPNYGQDPLNDAKEYSFILRLSSPILFLDHDFGSGGWDTVKFIDVLPVNDKISLSEFDDSEIDISCTLVHSQNGHHHAPAITWQVFDVEKKQLRNPVAKQ
jgi:hypothetical protein